MAILEIGMVYRFAQGGAYVKNVGTRDRPPPASHLEIEGIRRNPSAAAPSEFNRISSEAHYALRTLGELKHH